MGIPLFPRYILAAVVALTLSHAAFAQGTLCPTNVGRLVVHGVSDLGTVYVGPATAGGIFPIVDWQSYTPNGAEFTFTGCKGGGEFILYCTDPACNPSRDSLAAVYSNGVVDQWGNFDQWPFFNGGVHPVWAPAGRQDNTMYSAYWTWGLDDAIRPVTFNLDGTNQEVLWYANYDGGLVSFGTGSSSNMLTWQGT